MSDDAEPVRIEWEVAEGDDHPAWDEVRVLYCYSDPDSGEILYVGKADYCSVWERWKGHERDGVGRHLDRLGMNALEVRVGYVDLPAGARLSVELLGDIESLLIHRLSPCCNCSNTRSRTVGRTGMVVECVGDWPARRRRRFVDPGPSVPWRSPGRQE